ncbi:MAG: PmoA family protein [Alphaproteobacteria bacterium]|nr:PmoA family protein [Alphaproteobacteria bacterium]
MDRRPSWLAFAVALALLGSATLAHADPAIGARVDAVLADDTVTITEAGKTVLVYRTKPIDPALEPGRLNYVHPLYAPDGTVLTEDKPADHPHQRGVFWSWRQVLVNGKLVADGGFMKGLTFHVREKRFKGDAQGGGTLTVNADWIVTSGPELDYVARETTRVRVYPLTDGARRIDFDTLITARVDALGLGGSDDAKGYGGFSMRLVRPDRLTFASNGKTITPTDTALEAGASMGFAWPAESGSPAWTMGLTCKAHDQPIKTWVLRGSLSMQNCVFPGRSPYVIKKDQTLRLRETVIIRPATAPKPKTP